MKIRLRIINKLSYLNKVQETLFLYLNILPVANNFVMGSASNRPLHPDNSSGGVTEDFNPNESTVIG